MCSQILDIILIFTRENTNGKKLHVESLLDDIFYKLVPIVSHVAYLRPGQKEQIKTLLPSASISRPGGTSF